jgi:hypothetical protein
MAKFGAMCDTFAINIKIISNGDRVNRNFSFRENGWREPIIENKKPQIGDNTAKSKNRIRKSVGKGILEVVT